jgi:hypothetical protein
LTTAACGDGVRSTTEACEGEDLGGQTCRTLGFYNETTGLKCATDCTFDTSGCSGTCGDGIINGADEECDGAPPPGRTCLDYGYDRGLLGCSGLCRVVLDGCGKLDWQVTGPSNVSTVSGDGHDIYAAGADVFHWDGGRWTSMAAPIPVEAWKGVWSTGPNNVFAFEGGGVSRFDGSSWNWAAFCPGAPCSVNGIWGTGSNVFAFGQRFVQGVIVEESIQPWIVRILPNEVNGISNESADLPFPIFGAVWQMAGSGADDIYVVIDGSDWHWDGNAWSPVKIADENIASIWVNAVDDAYAVGSKATYHWDGMSWTPVTGAPGGFAIWGSGADDIFVFSATSPFTPNVTMVFHWDGVAWLLTYEGDVRSVAGLGTPESTLLAGRNGLLQPIGGLWRAATNVGVRDMWGVGEEIFAATQDGQFGQLSKGTAFKALEGLSVSPTSPWGNALWGTAPDNLWLSGVVDYGSQAAVSHWDGSHWSDPTSMGSASMPLSMGGKNHSDVWAVSDVARHWNGQAWSGPSPLAATCRAVWSRSPNEAFAVCDAGAIRRWNGASWVVMASGTTQDLKDVWGTDQDVFAVGSHGTILRLEQDHWTAMHSGTSADLRHVRGSGAGNVFTTTADGRLLHLRSGAWEAITIRTSGGAAISGDSLWVTPKSVYVAGSDFGGLVYRLDLLGVNCESSESDCSDGWDNDCDGLQDTADLDCAGTAVEQCANLADDDGDGLVDCADPDCSSFPSCKHR